MPTVKPETSGGFEPTLPLSPDLVAPAYDCLRLDGQLEKSLLSPAIHQVLLGVARLRNSVSSFRLEGEIVELDRARSVLDGANPETPSERGVLALAKEYERVSRESQTVPSVEGVLRLHRILFTGVLDPELVGRFKDRQNFIVAEGTHRLRFTPTPPERVRPELDALNAWYETNRWSMPPPLVASIYFAEFQAIHPFGDGNGRIGRLLNTIILKDLGLVQAPLVPFDTRLFRTSDAYYTKLATTNSGREYSLWARYFVHELRKAYRLASSRADLREVLARFSRPSTKSVLRWVLQGDSDWFTISEYPNKRQYSHPAVWAALTELVRGGVIETQGERRGRKYRLKSQFLTDLYGRSL